MAASDATMAARARRAYEWGRLGFGARRAGLLIPLAALTLLGCGAPADSLICGAALIALVTACLWRGQDWAAGVWPGVAAGAFPLLFPVMLRMTHAVCPVGSCLAIPACCALGGLAAGVLLSFLAPPPRAGRTVPFVVACTIAAFAGAAGCLVFGVVGLAVMTAGMAAGALPALALARSAASR